MNDENKRFLANPLEYCRSTVINLQGAGGFVTGFDANQRYMTAYFDLVPWQGSGMLDYFSRKLYNPDQVILTPQLTPISNGDSQIHGFFAPYRSYGEFTSGIASGGSIANKSAVVIKASIQDVMVEVDQQNPAHPFIFTGGQNGCSLLLVDLGVPGKYTAIHYPNSGGKAQGYPLIGQQFQIVLESHFGMYGTTGDPNAACFFYHDGNRWTLIYQPQIQLPSSDEDYKQNRRPKMGLRMNAPAQQV
jgi:hypothetical protein